MSSDLQGGLDRRPRQHDHLVAAESEGEGRLALRSSRDWRAWAGSVCAGGWRQGGGIGGSVQAQGVRKHILWRKHIGGSVCGGGGAEAHRGPVPVRFLSLDDTLVVWTHE